MADEFAIAVLAGISRGGYTGQRYPDTRAPLRGRNLTSRSFWQPRGECGVINMIAEYRKRSKVVSNKEDCFATNTVAKRSYRKRNEAFARKESRSLWLIS
ncbi:hypothetical protein [Sulfitobacter sp. S190]|uniref:hypothetical protein n=1 Tax=Sulfitobacter sp. S190 TaxID=2867022 RepID=UPI0021A4D716|nr:hypothetical protein [Sulfitobacter sp. S190]UWR21545.1 hypothetical protein K3756_12675 [Sulfitobacter sp. S190]